MNRVLLVLAHPRRHSLVGQVADRLSATLAAGGCEVEIADLVGEQFDPVMRTEDEPDWSDPTKRYSPAVQREIERIRRNHATVMVVPVYWWSMPAVLKGWIDRVWNHGFAYGAATYPHHRVWLIGVAGGKSAEFSKHRFAEAMQASVSTGVLGYCGVAERRLEVLYGAMEGPAAVSDILERTTALANEWLLASSSAFSEAADGNR